jgi:anthranilate phosphoribosyltransferase
MTIFNLLGPLLNPARPDFQLTGVYAPELLDLYAAALGLLGRRAAWAVHGGVRSGEGGFDELSIAGPSYVAAYRANSGEGAIERFVIDPMQLGDPIELGFSENSEMNSLIGGDASGNASRITAILAGAERGAARDMIVLNAAAALHLAGMAATLPGGVALAQESIDSGNATRALDMLRLASHEAAA